MHSEPSLAGKGGRGRLAALALGAIGVVYGDIGTSPLYAFREALRPVAGDGVAADEVIGIISLMIWSLTIIVTIKYVIFLLRADNNGEGGTLSLLALISDKVSPKRARLLFLFGVIGAALFVGDAMITPALSVLSAVEGMKLVTPAFDSWIMPLSLVILIALFSVQARGTATVSRAFGPITLVWFAALFAAGLVHLADDPRILAALNPFHAAAFLATGGFTGFIVLGAVFLTVTGAEALYADLGHFGRKPIRLAWLAIVFPSLTVNYLGQGALVLARPDTAADPFFLMMPDWALLPMVLLATAATIIASQAVITGAFSLTRQASHLGFLPRLSVLHTSAEDTGQIYVPAINALLLIGIAFLVLVFRNSGSLATAYGIAVTGAMLVTTLMFFDYLKVIRGFGTLRAAAIVLPLALLEGTFLSANLFKIAEGGYLPLLIGAGVGVIMFTWRKGTAILKEKASRGSIPLRKFAASLARSEHGPNRIHGTAIFLTSDPDATPHALLHNIKHNHVLHDSNIVLTVITENRPSVPPEDRAVIEPAGDGFALVRLHFGFMDTPNVSQALGQLRRDDLLKFDIMSTSFYVGRRKLVADPHSGLPRWQDQLFIALAGLAEDPSDTFRLPANRVVELGAHVSV